MSAHPNEPRLWSTLVTIEAQHSRWEESERLLRHLRERFGDCVLFRVSQAEYLAADSGLLRRMVSNRWPIRPSRIPRPTE